MRPGTPAATAPGAFETAEFRGNDLVFSSEYFDYCLWIDCKLLCDLCQVCPLCFLVCWQWNNGWAVPRQVYSPRSPPCYDVLSELSSSAWPIRLGRIQVGLANQQLTTLVCSLPSLPTAVCCALEYRPCAAGEHRVGNSSVFSLPWASNLQICPHTRLYTISPRDHPPPSILAI